MNKRLKKLNRLHEQTAAKIAALQAFQQEIDRERTEINNTEMLCLLGEYSMTAEELAELLKRAKEGPVVPRLHPGKEAQEDE